MKDGTKNRRSRIRQRSETRDILYLVPLPVQPSTGTGSPSGSGTDGFLVLNDKTLIDQQTSAQRQYHHQHDHHQHDHHQHYHHQHDHHQHYHHQYNHQQQPLQPKRLGSTENMRISAAESITGTNVRDNAALGFAPSFRYVGVWQYGVFLGGVLMLWVLSLILPKGFRRQYFGASRRRYARTKGRSVSVGQWVYPKGAPSVSAFLQERIVAQANARRERELQSQSYYTSDGTTTTGYGIDEDSVSKYPENERREGNASSLSSRRNRHGTRVSMGESSRQQSVDSSRFSSGVASTTPTGDVGRGDEESWLFGSSIWSRPQLFSDTDSKTATVQGRDKYDTGATSTVGDSMTSWGRSASHRSHGPQSASIKTGSTSRSPGQDRSFSTSGASRKNTDEQRQRNQRGGIQWTSADNPTSGTRSPRRDESSYETSAYSSAPSRSMTGTTMSPHPTESSDTMSKSTLTKSPRTKTSIGSNNDDGPSVSFKDPPSPSHPSISRIPSDKIIDESMKRLRARGIRLVAHGVQCNPKRVWIRFDDDTMSLTWQTEFPRRVTDSAGASSLVLMRGSLHKIAMPNVLYIDVGKRTSAFLKTDDKTVPESCCFSLLTQNGSLDLQANSNLERDSLVSCFSLILDQVHEGNWRAMYEESSSIFTESDYFASDLVEI